MTIPPDAICVLDRSKHRSFLSGGPRDAFTQAQFVSGNVVVVCATCGSTHLVESWEANGHICCGCKGSSLSARGVPASEAVLDFRPTRREKPVRSNSTQSRPIIRRGSRGKPAVIWCCVTVGLCVIVAIALSAMRTSAERTVFNPPPTISIPEPAPISPVAPGTPQPVPRAIQIPKLLQPIEIPRERIAVVDDPDGLTNLREFPSSVKSSRILDRIRSGERVKVLEQADGWLKVQRDSGKTGFITEKYSKLVDGTAYDRLNAFIREHHEKASRKDLDAFLADYSSRVNFFGKVNRSHAEIRADEKPYFDGAIVIRETVVSVLDQHQVSFGLFKFRYRLAVFRRAIGGDTMDKTTTVVMYLRMKNHRIEIVEQRHE